MAMPNFDPSSRCPGLLRSDLTVPEPSMIGCWAGSVRMAKIVSAGASMVRSTETLRLLSVMGRD